MSAFGINASGTYRIEGDQIIITYAEKEVIRRPIANRVHGNLTPAGYSAGSVEKYHYTPKPVVAVSVAARYFRMVSGSLSTFCPADTVSGRWVLAYLHLAVGSRNVSDECI